MKLFSQRENLACKTARVVLSELCIPFELVEVADGDAALPRLENEESVVAAGLEPLANWAFALPKAVPTEVLPLLKNLMLDFHDACKNFAAQHYGRAVDERDLQPMQAANDRVYALLDEVENALGDKDFLLGNEASLLDAFFIAPLLLLENLDLMISPDRTGLYSWKDELLERASAHV